MENPAHVHGTEPSAHADGGPVHRRLCLAGRIAPAGLCPAPAALAEDCPPCHRHLLLATAIALAVLSAQYPLAQSWLTAKVLGLVVYIALGLWVMRFARSQGQRALGYVLALATFGYIVAVAITRSPWPF